jgi:hypothetical protein
MIVEQARRGFVYVKVTYLVSRLNGLFEWIVQYNDSVVGPGSPAFDNAYFEISYIRAYTSAAVTPTSTQVAVQTETVVTTLVPSATSGSNATSHVDSSGATSPRLHHMACGLSLAVIAMTIGGFNRHLIGL